MGKIIKKNIKKISIITLLLIIAIFHLNIVITMAAESDLTITPKPETNNIHLKWTGPQNSSYKVYQKSQEQHILKQLVLQILVIM